MKFKNNCRAATTEVAEMKKSWKGTGGGQGKSIVFTPIEEIVLTLLGTPATGLTNIYCEDSGTSEILYSFIKM